MTDADINAAVARAVGTEYVRLHTAEREHLPNGNILLYFNPSGDWRDCGPLIARYGLSIVRTGRDGMAAWIVMCQGVSLSEVRAEDGQEDAALRRAICLAVVEADK